MKHLILALFAAFTMLTVNASESCIPENNLYLSHTSKSLNMTEMEFNKVIDGIEEIYAPIFEEEYKAKLKVVRKWTDGTVNAYAKQLGKTWEVHMFGGLARHKATTSDGFMAVVCHEIGHHIAGAPKKSSWYGVSWAANEGQSDYFATSKCLKKFFEKDIEETIKRYNEAKASEALVAKKACQLAHQSNEAEAAICYRGAMAGKSLATLLGSLGGNSKVKFGTPDKKVVSKTNHNHPNAQCRMDTYFQGALCDKDHMIFPSATDAAQGYCVRKDSYKVGIRPLCWFNPSQYNL